MNQTFKNHAVAAGEGENDDEFLITRHSQFQTPINVINVYGEIESRSSNKEIEERWQRILEKIARLGGNRFVLRYNLFLGVVSIFLF